MEGELKKNELPNPQKTQPQIQGQNNRFDLVRKISLRKAEEDYQKGLKIEERFHQEARKKGWTKTKEGKEAYKTWYRQYSKNIENEKKNKTSKKKT